MIFKKFFKRIRSMCALFFLALLALFFLTAPLRVSYSSPPSPSQNIPQKISPQVPLAENFQTEAKQALLIDLSTHSILFEKNADMPMVPSSMTKILTTYVIFEKLKKGELQPTDLLTVSKRAWRMGGSKMFVSLGSRVSVEDLLQGIIVQSGNDACVVIAEAISGSEEAFAELLNQKAKELGAKNTYFLNSTGWPARNHLTTARDLALIAERTIVDFPEAYRRYYPQKEFTYNKIKQQNRNPLLSQNLGDGLKTGHTVDGGYGLVGSGQQGERRLLFVINGLPTEKARTREASRLTQWGFREFQTYKLFLKGAAIDKADVWLGDRPVVPLVVKEDVMVTLRRSDRPHIKVVIRYQGPIEPPIKRGQVLGELVVTAPGSEEKTFPLIAGEDVGRAGFFPRILCALYYLLWGKGR